MSRMFLAQYNLRAYDKMNPLMPPANARWGGGKSAFINEPWPGGGLGANMVNWSKAGAYLFPIRVTAAMKMMVPPRLSEFPSQECPL
jgi:hypothetical protein